MLFTRRMDGRTTLRQNTRVPAPRSLHDVHPASASLPPRPPSAPPLLSPPALYVVAAATPTPTLYAAAATLTRCLHSHHRPCRPHFALRVPPPSSVLPASSTLVTSMRRRASIHQSIKEMLRL